MLPLTLELFPCEHPALKIWNRLTVRHMKLRNKSLCSTQWRDSTQEHLLRITEITRPRELTAQAVDATLA